MYGLRESVRLKGVDTEEVFHGTREARAELKRAATEDFEAYARGLRGESARPIKFGTPMGEFSAAFMRERLPPGTLVRLDVDELRRPRDIYTRWLAHVSIPDEDGEWRNLNEALVRAGHSPYFVKYGANALHDSTFERAERESRDAGRGVWGQADSDAFVAHYVDYDERLAWWRQRGRAVAAFFNRDESADAVPTVALGYWGSNRWLAGHAGQRVRLFAAILEANAAGHSLTLGHTARVAVHATLNERGFRAFEATHGVGEFGYVTGELTRAERGWRIDVSAAADVVLAIDDD